jgi:hypothetical protein
VLPSRNTKQEFTLHEGGQARRTATTLPRGERDARVNEEASTFVARPTANDRPVETTQHQLALFQSDIARRHGLTPIQFRRLKGLIGELACEDLGLSREEGLSHEEANSRRQGNLWHYLDEALTHLPRQRALALFHKGDVREMAFPALLVRWLTMFPLPLHAVDELPSLTRDFADHISEDQESLVASGRPSRRFGASPWLDNHLGYCLPLPPPAPAGLRDPFEEFRSKYPDALRVPRKRFLPVKIEVMQTIPEELRAGRADGVWTASADIIIEAVSAEDADSHLWMTRLLSDYVRDVLHGDVFPRPTLGSLLDLLDCIGHCERELRIGTFSQLRQDLGDLIRQDPVGAPQLLIESYFQVLDLPESMAALDRACLHYRAAHEAEKPLVDAQWNRACRFMREQLVGPSVVLPGVPRKLQKDYEALLRRVSEHSITEIAHGRPVPELSLSMTVRVNALVPSPGQDRRSGWQGPAEHPPICLTGRIEDRATNVVVIGDREVRFGDASFLRLLRICVERHVSDSGWVCTSDLHKEKLFTSAIPQCVASIRDPIRKAFGGDVHKKLIEHKGGRIRISTPSKLVTYNRTELLGHSNGSVREMAARLPGLAPSAECIAGRERPTSE